VPKTGSLTIMDLHALLKDVFRKLLIANGLIAFVWVTPVPAQYRFETRSTDNGWWHVNRKCL